MNTEIPNNSHLEIVHVRVDGVRLRESTRSEMSLIAGRKDYK